MTARIAFQKVWQNGKQVVQKVFSRGEKAGGRVKEVTNTAARNHQDAHQPKVPEFNRSFLSRVFPRVYYSTLASELRRKAASRFLQEQRASPLIAFGFGLAFCRQSQTDHEEDEISSKIRDISKKAPINGEQSLLQKVTELSLDNFEFGKLIGQGCNAAVYEARVSNNIVLSDVDAVCDQNDTGSDISLIEDEEIILEVEEESGDESFIVLGLESDSGEMTDDEIVILFEPEVPTDVEMEEVQNNGSAGWSPYAMAPQYDLAIKMMFNYGIESKATAITRAMHREAVPARSVSMQEDMGIWHNGNHVKKKSLPPHPNIVEMWGVFVDPVPALADALLQYPAALPQRLNPNGIGRNKTMFLVMKKYDQTLHEYLSENDPNLATRSVVLSQLIEGVLHMRNHQIAHRDMKSDNILLDLSRGDHPSLVISDFGCCLANTEHGMKLPYTSDEIDRGGNSALMAPEISTAEPGRFRYLDYHQADLWAVGALAYEIFGMENPFCGYHTSLDSRSYQDEELPYLSDNIPKLIENLVRRMLRRNPKQRPTPELAANVIQLFLWAPPDWLNRDDVERSEVKHWLLILAAEFLFVESFREQLTRTVEHELKRTFLARLDVDRVMEAVDFIHSLT